jgi:hypothetical protein
MLFQQTTAPTGWTKQTTHNNKALRVISGTAGFGGSLAFSSFFSTSSVVPAGSVNNTTLAAYQLGNHTHYFVDSNDSNAYYRAYPGGKAGIDIYANLGRYGSTTGGINEGSGGAHDHGFTGTAMNFDVQYVDLIIASKN